jgi:hypothetical protein
MKLTTIREKDRLESLKWVNKYNKKIMKSNLKAGQKKKLLIPKIK